MPFRWWHKSSPQPPGVSTGRHAVWQCRICRSPLWVWLLLCAQLFGSYPLLRRILFLWEIWSTLSAFLCRVKRMNGPPGSPGCFYIQAFLMSFRPYILWSAGQHGHSTMNDLWRWSHKQVHSGRWQAIYSILNLRENITLLAGYMGPVLILLFQLDDLRNISQLT